MLASWRAQADAQRPLNELQPVLRGTLRHERRKSAIVQSKLLHDDGFILDADGLAFARSGHPQCDYLGGFHEHIVARRCDS